MKGKPVRLFTCVWGDYLDLFENALVRSLNWPLNRAALFGAKWDLCTKKSDFEAAKEIASKIGIDIELHEIPDELHGSHPMMGAVLLNVFKPIIKRNIETGSRMLLAPPDTVFGGDTVENLLKIGEQKDTVVFVAHPRAHPSLLEELDPTISTGNGALVTKCWKHLHVSWAEAEYYAGVSRLNSYVGGVVWRKLNDETMIVTHRLPTPYVINWTEKDLAFFESAQVFGQIDHDWPSYCVVQSAYDFATKEHAIWAPDQERARYVGSSDAAFIVEITKKDANVPSLGVHSDIEPDKFWKNIYHNRFFRQVTIVFKKE